MAKTKKATSPIRSSNQIKEDDSQLLFAKCMKPWIVRMDLPRDFGIDAYVEITNPLINSGQIVTGKRFSVQLKSSTKDMGGKDFFSISIPTSKITYWNNAIEPILLVYVDLVSESCYFLWVDEKLITDLFNSNKNWIAQDCVTLKIPKFNELNRSSLLEIEKYVLSWKIASKSILTPGSYFQFNDEVKNSIGRFQEYTVQHNINFLTGESKALVDASHRSIYTIAIVGPTKAGKSTLINCLLRQQISPVGVLPTTGIPITIYPGAENKTTILLKDNREIHGDIDSDFLNQYTAQQSNQGNHKKVKLVSVHIVNSQLEKGVAFCDVPGLDDADIEIQGITKTALYNVNAIIYVISAAPFAHGDFSISRSVIDDLNSLGGRMERLFLVFNKIDVLTESQMSDLKEYILGTLTRFDVLKYLPIQPLYISSEQSLKNRIGTDPIHDSVTSLENVVWEYLLSQNKLGLYRLIENCTNAIQLFGRQRTLIDARMLNDGKRREIETEIQYIREEIENFIQTVYNHHDRIQKGAEEHIGNSLGYLIDFLNDDLSNVPLDRNLPDSRTIVTWLENNAQRVISEVYTFRQQELSKMQYIINRWVNDKLKQIGIKIDVDVSADTSQIDVFSDHINGFFENSIVPHGILEKVVYNIGNVITEIFVAIENIFTSDKKLRTKQIKIIVSNAFNGYDSIARSFLFSFDNQLTQIIEELKEKSLDRAEVYLGDLSSQLEKYERGISASEKNNLETFLTKIRDLELKVSSNLTHLKSYTYGLD